MIWNVFNPRREEKDLPLAFDLLKIMDEIMPDCEWVVDPGHVRQAQVQANMPVNDKRLPRVLKAFYAAGLIKGIGNPGPEGKIDPLQSSGKMYLARAYPNHHFVVDITMNPGQERVASAVSLRQRAWRLVISGLRAKQERSVTLIVTSDDDMNWILAHRPDMRLAYVNAQNKDMGFVL